MGEVPLTAITRKQEDDMLRFVLTLWVMVLVLFTGACAHTSGVGAEKVPTQEKLSAGWRYNGEIYVACPTESVVYQANKVWAGLLLLEDDFAGGCRPPRIVLLNYYDTEMKDPMATLVAEEVGKDSAIYAVPTSAGGVFHTIILKDGILEVHGTVLGVEPSCRYVGKPRKLERERSCADGICGDLYEIAIAKDHFSVSDSKACAPFFSTPAK